MLMHAIATWYHPRPGLQDPIREREIPVLPAAQPGEDGQPLRAGEGRAVGHAHRCAPQCSRAAGLRLAWPWFLGIALWRGQDADVVLPCMLSRARPRRVAWQRQGARDAESLALRTAGAPRLMHTHTSRRPMRVQPLWLPICQRRGGPWLAGGPRRAQSVHHCEEGSPRSHDV
jgi:hypothetical protein